MADRAFWSGAPVPVRRVRVRIGLSVLPSHWCYPLRGQERDALELTTPEGLVLIDDEDGVGLRAVSAMYRRGGYSRLPADSVIIGERAGD